MYIDLYNNTNGLIRGEQIINLCSEDKEKINDVANLLLKGFKEAWNNMEECLHEVEETLQEDRISRVAVSTDGKVLIYDFENWKRY